MSATDKLLRAFEALKVYYEGAPEDDPKKKEVLSTKERSFFCSSIPDLINTPSIKNLPEFGKLISIAIEILLIACDDSESDVRMVADEVLNKTIKVLMDINIGRVHIELYKEIKKNGTSRSLRAAIWRFADLCHLIRPQKCRTFALNALPRIVRICKRQDDSIQDTVASALQKICPVFGKFINDSEVKILIRNFLINIKSSSAAARRTAASAVTLLCRHTTKPNYSFAWLVSQLIDILLPLQSVYQQNFLLLGALLCLRSIVPYLSSPIKDTGSGGIHGTIGGIITENPDSSPVNIMHLIKMYGIVMACLKHSNHNVVTAALETLQLLLKSPPKSLLSLLLSDPDDTLINNVARIGNSHDLSSNNSGTDLDQLESKANNMEVGLDPSTSNIDNKEGLSTDSIIKESNDEAVEIDLADGVAVQLNLEQDSGNSNANHDSSTTTSQSAMEGETNEDDSLADDDSNDINRPAIDSGDISRIWDRLVDSNKAPIVSCIRMLCTSFLLDGESGQLIPDKTIRVSVKVLSLNCVSQALGLCPQAFIAPLYVQLAPDCQDTVDGQISEIHRVLDVLQYTNHSDPKLRGNIALLISNYIKTSLIVAGYQYDLWLHSLSQQIKNEQQVYLESFVNLILTLLKDESSVVIGMALEAVKLCLNSLMMSDEGQLSWNIIATALRLKIHPYWLVRVKLLDIITELDFILLHYWRQSREKTEALRSYCSPCTQQQVLDEVIMTLLGDEDIRVRQATTAALIKIIPRLFYPIDHPKGDYITAAAQQSLTGDMNVLNYGHDMSKSLSLLTKGSAVTKTDDRRQYVDDITLANLSRIIDSLLAKLHITSSKHFMIGCLHALSVLSDEYPVHQYSSAWGYHRNRPKGDISSTPNSNNVSRQNSFGSLDDISGSNGSGPLPLIISLLTSSWVTYDLQAHNDVLSLACNLLLGASLNSILTCDNNTGKFDITESWPALSDFLLVPLANQLFTHISRLLNIFTHVIDDLPTTIPQTQKAKEFLREKSGSIAGLTASASAGSLAAVVSPKKRFSFRNRGDSAATSDKKESSGSNESSDYASRLSRIPDTGIIGQFANIPHYFKLYEELKNVQSSYQSSLATSESEDKFAYLLKTTLNNFAKILEVATLNETGRYVEEFVNYMQACIKRESAATLHCVQQFIRCLFNINAATNPWQIPISVCKSRYTCQMAKNVHVGFHQIYSEIPLKQFAVKMAGRRSSLENVALDEDGISVKPHSRLPASETGGRADNKRPVQLIRIFEPLVIYALKQYTFTSSVDLQQRILHLLAQLIKIRVNYSLLDADQSFVNFILRQFELIEAGQMKESENIIPSIFQFLILLSYERMNFEPIVGIPRILQLSDGIMASGQLAPAHVIPAFRPVVFDLFNVRSLLKPKGEEGKQLDAQREVVIATLMKLMDHHETIELCLVILSSCRDEENRWKRVSRQMVDFLLPLLTKLQVNVDCVHALYVIHQFFEMVMPISLRPIDMFVKAFFMPAIMENEVKTHRWLATILIVFHIFLLRADENSLLARIEELRIDNSHFISSDNDKDKDKDYDPVNVFTQFIFYIIKNVTEKLVESITTPTNGESKYEFLGVELRLLFLYLKYIIKKAVYKRFTEQANLFIEDYQRDGSGTNVIGQINILILELRQSMPRLVLDWCELLLLLEYTDQVWWEQLLLSGEQVSKISLRTINKLPSCSHEVIRRGIMLLLCDSLQSYYQGPNFNQIIPWFISNYALNIIELSHESPVVNLLNKVNCDIELSSIYLNGIGDGLKSSNRTLLKPSFGRKLARCLSDIHDDLTGSLIVLVITHFLDTHHRCIGRLFETLVCNRLDLLLTESIEDCQQQLADGKLETLIRFLKDSCKLNRHLRLKSLIIRILNHIEVNIDEINQLNRQLSLNPAIQVDKDWFLDMIKNRCFQDKTSVTISRKYSLLLRSLPLSDAVEILKSQEFDITLLENCLNVCLTEFQRPKSDNTEAVDSHDNNIDQHEHGKFFLECVNVLMNRITDQLNKIFIDHKSDDDEQKELPHNLPSASASAIYGQDTTTIRLGNFSEYKGIIHDAQQVKIIHSLTKCLAVVLESEVDLSANYHLPDEFIEAAARFALLSLGVSSCMITELIYGYEELHTALSCASVALFSKKYVSVYSSPSYHSAICQCVDFIYNLITSIGLTPGSVLVPSDLLSNFLQQSLNDDRDIMIFNACNKLSQLLYSYRTTFTYSTSHQPILQIPQFLVGPFISVMLGLARLPLFNSYCCVPLLAWKMGWLADNQYNPSKPLPPLSPDYLCEKEILEEFVFRINLLGWTSRQQFEEIWVALLGVLGTPIREDASNDEIAELNHSNCIAIEGLTSLLLHTSLVPIAGRPDRCIYLHTSRHKPLPFMNTDVGKKLEKVRRIVEKSIEKVSIKRTAGWTSVPINYYNNMGCIQSTMTSMSKKSHFWLRNNHNCRRMLYNNNTERDISCLEYVLGQVPISVLRTQVSETDNKDDAYSRATIFEEDVGLDIHSCLQFLIELFERWLTPQGTQNVTINLKREAAKSILVLSDVFVNREHFQWMYDTFMELYKFHPAEDDVMMQYIVIGICKSISVLGLDGQSVDKISRVIEFSLKSSYLSLQICGLFGALYILEPHPMSSLAVFLDPLINYLTTKLSEVQLLSFGSSYQHTLVMLSAAFFIIEHYVDDIKDTNFFQLVLNIVMTMISASDEVTPPVIYHAIMRGLERVILSFTLTPDESDMIVKLSIDRLSMPSPERALSALGLLLTCMYAGKVENEINPSEELDAMANVHTIERVTILFDRIRKGLPSEAAVVARILPSILEDFFSPQEIMNKVIGEFLSNQQPHPQLMAEVLFKVFENLQRQSQQTAVTKWAMLSIGSFTQRTPLAMAVWGLNCLLISASTNYWIRSLLPYVISRMGKLEQIDKQIFYTAALDFFVNKNLDQTQKRTFLSTFTSSVSPYSDLNRYCQQHLSN